MITRRDVRSLAWAGALGGVGHVALDLIAGADIRLLWPVFSRPLPWPLFAMADPWLFGMLLISALLVIRSAGRRWVGLSLILLVGLIGAKAVMHGVATGIGQTAAETVTVVHVEAVWGSLTHWIRYEADPASVEASDIDVAAGSATLFASVPRNLDDPIVRSSETFDTVRNLLASHDVTFVYVVHRDDGGVDVRWSDLTVCAPPRRVTASRARSRI